MPGPMPWVETKPRAKKEVMLTPGVGRVSRVSRLMPGVGARTLTGATMGTTPTQGSATVPKLCSLLALMIAVAADVFVALFLLLLLLSMFLLLLL